MKEKASIAAEDYLEALYELIEQKGFATTGTVAERVGVHPSTATRMLKKLDGQGLAKFYPYSNATLTNRGKQIGQKIHERHKVLDVFLQLLGIDDCEKRAQDIEGLEHHLSEETLRALESLTVYLKEHSHDKR